MVPYTKTEITNIALGHFGADGIDNIDTDESLAGKAARTFFDVSLQAFVRAHDWAWARRRVVLGLVLAAPSVEWGYAHRLPVDLLAPRRIVSGTRIDNDDTEIEYELGTDVGGGLLYSDLENPELVYTVMPADVSAIPADVVIAYSFKLAQLLAGRIVREDPFEIVRRMEREYEMALDKAMVAALKDEKRGQPPEQGWLRSRR